MKKSALLCSVMFLIGFGMAQGQTSQGNFMVGLSSNILLTGTTGDLVNVGFSRVKYKSDREGFEEGEPDKANGFNLAPQAAYFIMDNFAVGLDLFMSRSSQTQAGEETALIQSLYSAGPFIRYYMPTSKVFPFVELGATFGRLNTKAEGDFGFEDKNSLVNYSGGVGLAAPLGEKVMLDIMGKYNNLLFKATENNENNDRTIISNIGLQIGITVFLGSN